MADLFPAFDIPDDVEDVDDAAVVTYGKAWAFDFTVGDFVLIGGKVPIVDGYEAWAAWCVKNVLTTRFGYVVYSDDYGVDFDAARTATSRAEAEMLIETEVREALEQDERTGSAREFEFEWEGDSLRLSFVLEPTEGTAERIHVDLRGVH